MKMNKKYILPILLVLAGSLFNACRESDTPSEGNDQGSVPLSISGVSVTDSLVKTRAELASVSDIGVFRLAANGYTAQNNMEYKNTGGTWAAADNSNRILLGSSDATLCTYAPYSSAVTDFASVPLNSGIYSASTDLCYACNTGVNFNNMGSGVSFPMKHAYAELTINFTRDQTLIGSGNVTAVTISGAASSGKFNISSGALTSVTSGNVAFSGSPLCNVSSSSVSRSIEALMVPVSLSSSGLTFSINVDGIIKTCTVPSSQISKLESGKNYTVNINLSGSIQPESNCYIVVPGSTIYIPVSRATTGNAGEFPSGSPFTCGLLWSDASATHATVTPFGRYIKVVAGNQSGNSVIFARNSSGNIVWSWHIWVTDLDPNTSNSYYHGLYVMNFNLGSKTGTDYGLYYQWGRKDPFPAATTTIYGSYPMAIASGPVALATSIHNPNIFYANPNYFDNTYNDWLTPQNGGLWGGAKSVYDPCPTGWYIPHYSIFMSLFPSNNTLSGCYNSSGGYSSGGYGYWWSSSSYAPFSYNLFSDGTVTAYGRSSGFSVRCIKE
jgi:hypothetical protein